MPDSARFEAGHRRRSLRPVEQPVIVVLILYRYTIPRRVCNKHIILLYLFIYITVKGVNISSIQSLS